MMINQLRAKLITVTMIAVAIMLIIIFALMNIMNFYHTTQNADDMLAFIAENNGILPEILPEERERNNRRDLPSQFNEESPYQTRYFIVQYDKLRNIIDINTSHVAAVTESAAIRHAAKALNSGFSSGYSNMYRYLVQDTDFGKIVIFLDCSLQLQSTFAMILTSCFIALFCMMAIFIVIFMFSKRVIKPMIDNIEKQKRFVTDAGHELKTPLAIINANVEVLELMNGSNEWLGSIKNQVSRLDKLVKSMLQLAKMEETSFTPIYGTFDLSKTFFETAQPFITMAKQNGKTLKVNSAQNVSFHGDENAIKNLISIFIDNAIKYSNEGGTIKASLKREGKNITIEVRNSADSIDETSLGRLFDRFYRPDSSRSRDTGGYGIGLSMARRIVESHKGKISASKINDHTISFRVVFKTQSAVKIRK